MPMKSLNRGLLGRGRVSTVVLTAGEVPGDPTERVGPWVWSHEEYRKVAAAMKQVLKGSRTVFFI